MKDNPFKQGELPGFSGVKSQLEIDFEEFHEANPHVYTSLVDMTRDLRERGREKIGIGMLFEVLRWQHYMKTDDPNSEYKLNNNHRSRYARMIMERNPDLDGMFELRKLHN